LYIQLSKALLGHLMKGKKAILAVCMNRKRYDKILIFLESFKGEKHFIDLAWIPLLLLVPW
jgi:hypothetical protein